ncbi:MAG: glutamine amidotransferase [archaeon YNP-WB-040]|nr:glutamine amidotransferase [Candidatus Culexarchaeum yellowstonense]
MKPIKMLYVGDSGVVVGPIIFESPFIVEIKDVYYRNWAKYFIEAINGGGIEVTHMESIKAYREFPRSYNQLREYDVIMLSDVSSENIRFYPEFFPIEEVSETRILKRGEYLGMPDRLELIRRYVEDGGGLIMAGGWYSYSGRFGQGAWYRTPVEEALPVEIMEFDDRVEKPIGIHVKAIKPEHPIMRGIPWETCPPLLGYNKVKPKEKSEVLAVVESGDPLIVVWSYGKGRSMAFTSDPVLHWGINFIKWEYYKEFWIKAIRWVCKIEQ